MPRASRKRVWEARSMKLYFHSSAREAELLLVQEEGLLPVQEEDPLPVQEEDLLLVQEKDLLLVQGGDLLLVQEEDLLRGQEQDLLLVQRGDLVYQDGASCGINASAYLFCLPCPAGSIIVVKSL